MKNMTYPWSLASLRSLRASSELGEIGAEKLPSVLAELGATGRHALPTDDVRAVLREFGSYGPTRANGSRKLRFSYVALIVELRRYREAQERGKDAHRGEAQQEMCAPLGTDGNTHGLRPNDKRARALRTPRSSSESIRSPAPSRVSTTPNSVRSAKPKKGRWVP